HIAAFGGDPSRVTLMGQSAGAMSVARLLMLEETSGLLRRVILQSAGLGRGYLSPVRAASISDQFLNLMGIDPASPDVLAQLRAAAVPRLLQAQGAVTQAHVRFGKTAPAFMGACHNIELAFVFGTLEAWRGSPMLAGGDSAQMDGLSAAMRGAWIAFV